MNINVLDETEDMHSVGIIHIAQQKTHRYKIAQV